MIKLSKTGSYSLKAVIFIAKNDKLTKIKEISKSENISESLLRRIIANLEKTEILKTIKGRNGGVSLNKNPKLISLYDILNAVGEELGISNCSKGVKCDNIGCCSTTGVILSLQKGFNSLLKIYTLDKIISTNK